MAQAAGMASGISGMIGSNMQQAASRRQLYDQAVQSEMSISDIDLQAAQRSESRAEQLASALATTEAKRAASGLSLDSPTAQAIERQMRKAWQKQGAVENASAAQARAGLMAKAKMLRQAGYEAGKLLDFKFGLNINPADSNGDSKRWLYGGSSEGMTSTGEARSVR